MQIDAFEAPKALKNGSGPDPLVKTIFVFCLVTLRHGVKQPKIKRSPATCHLTDSELPPTNQYLVPGFFGGGTYFNNPLIAPLLDQSYRVIRPYPSA